MRGITDWRKQGSRGAAQPSALHRSVGDMLKAQLEVREMIVNFVSAPPSGRADARHAIHRLFTNCPVIKEKHLCVLDDINCNILRMLKQTQKVIKLSIITLVFVVFYLKFQMRC